jgi:hypothetical protein
MAPEKDRVVEAIEHSLDRLDDLRRASLGTGQAWSSAVVEIIAAIREPLEQIAAERKAHLDQMLLPTKRPD